jgi:hypothetical protein
LRNINSENSNEPHIWSACAHIIHKFRPQVHWNGMCEYVSKNDITAFLRGNSKT